MNSPPPLPDHETPHTTASSCSHANRKKRKIQEIPLPPEILGAKCRLGTAEDNLIKDLFIAFMFNPDKKREILMETLTHLQVLQFDLNCERGQENQRAINTQLNRHPLPIPHQISFIQRNQTPSQNPRQRKHNQNPQQRRNGTPSNPCRRCGVQLTQEHLQVCPAKKSNAIYVRKYAAQLNSWGKVNNSYHNQNYPQTRGVRNTREATNAQTTPNTDQDSHLDKHDETVDLKNTFLIQEIIGNWSTVNFIKPNSFKLQFRQTLTQTHETKYGFVQHPTKLKSIG